MSISIRSTTMRERNLPSADIERLDTWLKYKATMCASCKASCCTLPVEVNIADLVRMQLLDAFEADEPPKELAKKLKKSGVVEHFNFSSGIFTLTRLANGDCIYLDTHTRRCTIYEKRPQTCRNHPRVGPRPGYCAYLAK
ncbi:MAG: Fe-S-cluster oxidoreductase [Verrucomicrobiaceae bacterium]|nr:Fe-S-cluster oxidoreductase [Verrucomicrobiaceae bacterium]